jgi:hypothetical protein
MPTGNRRGRAKRRRKPSRLLIAKRSRAARRGEQFIASYEFPDYFPKRVSGGGCGGGGCGGGGS